MYSIRKLYYNILYYITVLLYVISTNQGAAQFWQNMRDRVQAWRKSHQDQTDVEEDETARYVYNSHICRIC